MRKTTVIKGKWTTRTGFILAAIGSAIGLGSIWRFPYIVYENGGGAFLIPYFFALFVIGIPMMIMEVGVGSKTGSTAPLAVKKLVKKGEFLGWWASINAFIILTYYIVILGWTFSYFGYSFTMAWGGRPDLFFGHFLNGYYPLIATLVAWAINYIIVCAGVENGLERMNKFFVPALWAIVIMMIIGCLRLDGAYYGLIWYLKPDFSSLLSPKIWISAFGQVFFSLSLVIGTMITYASYQPKNSDVAKNSSVIAFVSGLFSFVVGFAIFSALGQMSVVSGIPISNLIQEGTTLAFITFPAVLNIMPVSILFSMLFFLILIFAGLTSSVSLLETATGPIIEKFNISREKTVSILTIVGCLISLPFALNAGNIELIDKIVSTYGLPFLGFAEVIVFGWIYGADKLRTYINSVSDFKIGRSWTWLIKIFIPIVLGYVILDDVLKRPVLAIVITIVLLIVLAFINARRSV